MQVRLTKCFDLEMAHALPGYNGECRNLHGHTFHLAVTVRGRPRQQAGHPQDGMVLDFKDLKQVVKTAIVDVFDHALVLPESFSPETVATLRSQFDKVITLPFQPTCENVLVHFVGLLQPLLPPEITLWKLYLQETATSYAEWHFDDNCSSNLI